MGTLLIVSGTANVNTMMNTWSKDELRKIAEADDLHISPMRRHDTGSAVRFEKPDVPKVIQPLTERADEGVERIKALTAGIGADSVLECVGTQESMIEAIRATRPGGSVGDVRGFLPELIDLIWKWRINPGKVFDLTLPLDRVAQAIARWTTVARSKHCSARNRKESENNR
jgi:hypothetical protein